MNREELNQLTHKTFGRYTHMDMHDFMGTDVAVVLCKTGCVYIKSRFILVWCTDIDKQVCTRLPVQCGSELFQERHYGLFVYMDWMSFAYGLRRIRPILLPGVKRRYFSFRMRQTAKEYKRKYARVWQRVIYKHQSRNNLMTRPFGGYPINGWF